MNQPLTIALRLARHPVNDLERVALSFGLIPHLRPGENVDTGALRILADRVEWLEGEAEQCRVALHDVASGRVDSRVRQERDTAQAGNASLFEQVGDLTAELAEARADIGRQAATIAAMHYYSDAKPVRFEFDSHKTFGGAGYRRDAGHSQ